MAGETWGKTLTDAGYQNDLLQAQMLNQLASSQHQQAQVNATNAAAEESSQIKAILNSMAQQGQDRAPTGPTAVGMSQQYLNAAAQFMRAGLLDQSQKASKLAAEIQAKDAEGQKDLAQRDKTAHEYYIATLKSLKMRLANVTNQQELNEANQVYTALTQQMSPFQVFSAQGKEKWLDHLAREEFKITESQRRREQARMDADVNSKIEYRTGQLQLGAQRNEIARRQSVKDTKVGVVSAPGAELQAQVYTRLKAAYKDMEPADLQTFAYDVASQAMGYVKLHRGLDMATAIARAQADVAKDLPSPTAGRFGLGKVQKYTPPKGLFPEAPATAPLDPNTRVVGRWYTVPNGQVLQWGPKGFLKQEAPAAATPEIQMGEE